MNQSFIQQLLGPEGDATNLYLFRGDTNELGHQAAVQRTHSFLGNELSHAVPFVFVMRLVLLSLQYPIRTREETMSMMISPYGQKEKRLKNI